MIYFPGRKTAIKRVRCEKFTDSYNSSLSKPDKNTEFPEYFITHDIQLKDNQNTEVGGANQPLSNPTEERIQIFFGGGIRKL